MEKGSIVLRNYVNAPLALKKKLHSNPLKQSKENTCKSFIVDYLGGEKCESILEMLEEIGFLAESWVRIPELN
jgi:prephenate dehydratase